MEEPKSYLKIKQAQGNRFEVYEIHYDAWEYADDKQEYEGDTLFTGNILECDTYIRLHKEGIM